MKKVLLSLFLIATAAMSYGQCTPDASVTSGISPDTATGMAVSYVGQPYSEVFTFVVPLDTSTVVLGQTVNVTVNYIQLDNVVGLPNNYTYNCNPANCQFPGGTTKCVDMVSTSNPTLSQVGSYPISIETTANVTAPFPIGTINQAQTPYDGYYLVIDQQSGLFEHVGTGQMKSLIAYPNPTNGNTTIEFAMGYDTKVEFTVTNLLGEVLDRQKLNAPKGLNRIQFDASDVPNGIYTYSITDGQNAITKKLIVNK